MSLDTCAYQQQLPQQQCDVRRPVSSVGRRLESVACAPFMLQFTLHTAFQQHAWASPFGCAVIAKQAQLQRQRLVATWTVRFTWVFQGVHAM
jgi:hypothetical protein